MWLNIYNISCTNITRIGNGGKIDYTNPLHSGIVSQSFTFEPLLYVHIWYKCFFLISGKLTTQPLCSSLGWMRYRSLRAPTMRQADWIFGLCLASTEDVLENPESPAWIFFFFESQIYFYLGVDHVIGGSPPNHRCCDFSLLLNTESP